jgi:hypothetical protein
VNRANVACMTAIALAGAVCQAHAQSILPSDAILRVETEMHGAAIRTIGIDASCRAMVTGSDDRTARLWALPANGEGAVKLQRVLRVPVSANPNEGKVYGVALSPNGKFVAVGGWGQYGDSPVYIFDRDTGKITHRLRQDSQDSVINRLTFSADGKYLAATLSGGAGLRVWETAGWHLVALDKAYADSSYDAAFDATGALYTVSYDGYVRRYGPDFTLDYKMASSIGGRRPASIAVHPKGDRIAVAFHDASTVSVFSTKTLKPLFTTGPLETAGFIGSIAWSSDGTRLIAGGYDQTAGKSVLRIWEDEGRGAHHNMFLGDDIVMRLMACHNAVGVSTADPAFGLISLAGEKLVWQEATKPDMRNKLGSDFTVSGDGSKVRFGLSEGGKTAVEFDALAGRLVDQPQPAVGFSPPNTSSLRLTDWQNHRAPKIDGKQLTLDQFEASRSVAIAPGNGVFVLGSDWYLRAFDKQGRLLWQRSAPATIWGVNIPAAGKYVIAAYDDGTIRWHRLSDGQEIISLFVQTKAREWVLWTPEGYYTSSVAGDQYVNLGFLVTKGSEQEFLAPAQLKKLRKQFYRPDVVKRAFELADAGSAAREAGLSAPTFAELTDHTPPEFVVIDPKSGTHEQQSPAAVTLDVTTTNDPVTGFDVLVNGRQTTTRDVRDLDKPITEAGARKLNIPLEPGENHVQVTAHNAIGDSVQDLLIYLDRGGVVSEGKLFILAIGVDKFPKLGPKYSLNYAGADAGLIVETLASKARSLHTGVKIEMLVSDGANPPTRANIIDALDMFREAGPEDTVILFLAGHGVNEGPDYLFLPEDADDKDGHWRLSSMVRWLDLQRALQTTQGRRIMFVDTCHSGGAYNPRLIKDAADANIIVFSATDEVTLAQERGALGHGVFTYALAKGISGEADVFKRGTINILPLAGYVSDTVKQITDGAQEPTYNMSGSKDFVLATH